jgi:4-oxalocrotonate tautomerase
MPTIFFYGPKLDKDQSRDMIKSFTDTASRLTGIARSSIVVYLREALPDHVGVGGELLEDKQKKAGKG